MSMDYGESMPGYDADANCAKCGSPLLPETGEFDISGNPVQGSPLVQYCNGEECPWLQDGQDPVDEHMHQTCPLCGFQWAAKPLS